MANCSQYCLTQQMDQLQLVPCNTLSKVYQPTYATPIASQVPVAEFEWVAVSDGTEAAHVAPQRYEYSATGSSDVTENRCCKCNDDDIGGENEWAGESTGSRRMSSRRSDMNEDWPEDEDEEAYFIGRGRREEDVRWERKTKGRKGKSYGARKGSREMVKWQENVKGEWNMRGWDRDDGPHEDEDGDGSWEIRGRKEGRWDGREWDREAYDNSDGEWDDSWERRDIRGRGSRSGARVSKHRGRSGRSGGFMHGGRGEVVSKREARGAMSVHGRGSGRGAERGAMRGRERNRMYRGRWNDQSDEERRWDDESMHGGGEWNDESMHGGEEWNDESMHGGGEWNDESMHGGEEWNDESMHGGEEWNDNSMHGGSCPVHGGGGASCPKRRSIR